MLFPLMLSKNGRGDIWVWQPHSLPHLLQRRLEQGTVLSRHHWNKQSHKRLWRKDKAMPRNTLEAASECDGPNTGLSRLHLGIGQSHIRRSATRAAGALGKLYLWYPSLRTTLRAVGG